MTFYIKGHRFGYELQRLAQTFFFGQKIEVIEGAPDDGVNTFTPCSTGSACFCVRACVPVCRAGCLLMQRAGRTKNRW